MIDNSKKKNISKRIDNKNVRMILIIILVMALGILITTTTYTIKKNNEYRKIISYRIINTSVEISTNNGLNGDRDGLKYGKTTPGGAGIRYLDFNTTQDVIINIYISGNMTQFLTIDENNFLLPSGTEKKLPIYLTIPTNTSLGFYEGIIKVVMTKP